LTSVSVANFALPFAESDPIDWSLTVALLVGGAIGFLVIWVVTRHTRRVAHENAAELIEVAKREAAVAAQELKQKAEEEIAGKPSSIASSTGGRSRST
jgi:ribonuclease Y